MEVVVPLTGTFNVVDSSGNAYQTIPCDTGLTASSSPYLANTALSILFWILIAGGSAYLTRKFIV